MPANRKPLDSHYFSKLSIVLQIAIIIFMVEGLVMFAIIALGEVSNLYLEAFLDAFSMTLIASPIIYHFVIRPFVDRKQQAENALLKIQDELELRVQQRTAELNEARKSAEKANTAKSMFLSHMSHELRTPLTSILGFSELLLVDEQLTSEQKDNADEIQNAGNHLLQLINDLLDLAKIESGNYKLMLENLDLLQILEECRKFVAPSCSDQQITLSVDHSCIDEVIVHADRLRLKQVILNLLSNAIKYNHPGGSIIIKCNQPDNNAVRLMISDTGKGIAREQLTELFTPFSRLGTESGKIEGTGIGLTIVKQLLEMMHGSIEVESEPEQGTTFLITIPLA